jgi:hypothetical protein
VKVATLVSLIPIVLLICACDHKVEFNKLSIELDSIFNEDQRCRELYLVLNYSASDSLERAKLLKQMNKVDSSNIARVSAILECFGWLGAEEVGEIANSCIFLVIQHSDQRTRERFLPIMREAVKKGKAKASDLAFLEDRVALGRGKKQIYGTQLYKNTETGDFEFFPIEDELTVNNRRKDVGLNSIEDRAQEFGFIYKHKSKE